MEVTKFNNTYKCKGHFTIYKKGKEYDSEYFEIKNIITTTENVYDLFYDKLYFMAQNEITALGEENVKSFVVEVDQIIANN
jgi:hypothetical protein